MNKQINRRIKELETQYQNVCIKVKAQRKIVNDIRGQNRYGYVSSNRPEFLQLGQYVNLRGLLKTELIHLYMKARGLAE